MPKPSTKKTTEVVQETVVSAPVVVAPVVTESKPKKAASKTVAPAPAAAPIVTTPVVAAPVVEEVPVIEESALIEKSIEFLAKLSQIGTLISSLKSEYRTLEKTWTKELKTAQKASSKKKRRAGNRKPSGFVQPTRISDELAKFLDKPVGSMMARTEVTREVNAYIRGNDLQDKSNGRKIIPDAKLASLLKLGKTDELTYFNLQKYMSPHFAKASAEVIVA